MTEICAIFSIYVFSIAHIYAEINKKTIKLSLKFTTIFQKQLFNLLRRLYFVCIIVSGGYYDAFFGKTILFDERYAHKQQGTCHMAWR